MNAQEIAVGVAETAAYDGSCYGKQVRQISAALWHVRSGRVSELPPLPGDPDAVAHAINVWGNVAGGSGTCAQAEGFALPNHAVLWRHGKPQDLGNLGGSAAFAAAINDQNQVVGWANLPGDAAYHAFLWHGGRMTDLGTLPGDISSIATGINDEGQIVGASFDASGGKRAFVCRHGKMVDLNSLVPPSGTLSVLQANAINSYGEIVGYAGDTQVRGHISGFLAIPTGSIRSF
ncbi:MAG TPA: hypothetical protein VMV37_06850 [Gammaproteobacteria bacterium]|nr:hypothetical protein [Gammaproteobacteria bacterium]